MFSSARSYVKSGSVVVSVLSVLSVRLVLLRRRFLWFWKLFRAKCISAFVGLLSEVSCVAAEGKVVFRQIRRLLARSFLPSGAIHSCVVTSTAVKTGMVFGSCCDWM